MNIFWRLATLAMFIFAGTMVDVIPSKVHYLEVAAILCALFGVADAVRESTEERRDAKKETPHAG